MCIAYALIGFVAGIIVTGLAFMYNGLKESTNDPKEILYIRYDRPEMRSATPEPNKK